MKEYIYINNKSLSKEICYDIINKFNIDLSNNKCYKGITSRGLDISFKNTFDLQIGDSNDIFWIKIKEFLLKELKYNVKQYLKNINKEHNKNNYDFTCLDYNFLNFNRLKLQMQKYEKNKGIFLYHNDFNINNEKYRILVFLWYLNTVENGGETEFFGDTSIKPEIGKLILFPACWCYPHCGKIPLSDDKYIITGWIYNN